MTWPALQRCDLLHQFEGICDTQRYRSSTIIRARQVHVPGDGNCLFHSLAYHLGDGYTHDSLRRHVQEFVRHNHSATIYGTSVGEWIKWETGKDYKAYADHIQQPGTWGGAIDMAIISKMMSISIAVYISMKENSYRRVALFGNGEKRVDIFYNGGSHYTALDVDS